MIKIFYRISDGSYKKDKLPCANKEVCLRNFIDCFSNSDITFIADNCNKETISICNQYEGRIIETNLGNAQSAMRAIELAIEEVQDDDIVYFIEDDYLHNPKYNCSELIVEGLNYANYVTLFDHPDKYMSEYDYGEETKVYKTRHSHWKHSISTTMTFAAKVKELKEDYSIWEKHTSNQHPNDHFIFTEIREKGKKLGVKIPGVSFHVDLTYQIQKYIRNVKVNIDSWVIPTLEETVLRICDQDIRYLNENHVQNLMIISQVLGLQAGSPLLIQYLLSLQDS